MPKESPATSVARALAMLEAIAARREGMTNSEISRRLGIPKSSASYILRALEQRRFLRREADSGRYTLGLKILALGDAVEFGKEIRGLALPFLRHLVQRTELTAHLAVLDRGEAVYVERVEAPGFIKMDTWVGRRMPVHTTSVGKALAAYLPKEDLDELLQGQNLKPRTPKSITSRSRFLRELERIRSAGYAVDDEENNLGARCVAATVFNSQGQGVGAVGVSGATSQITKPQVAKVALLVRETARRISVRLGYQPALSAPYSTASTEKK